MKKKITAIILVLILCFSTLAFAADTHRTIEVDANLMTVLVNGKKVEADNFVYNGTTYLPLRAVSEALGNDVDYDPNTQSAIISSGDLPKIINNANLYNRLQLACNVIDATLDEYDTVLDYVLNPTLYTATEVKEYINQYYDHIDQLYVIYIESSQEILSWMNKDKFYETSLKKAKECVDSIYDVYSNLADCADALYDLAASPSSQSLYNTVKNYQNEAFDLYINVSQTAFNNYQLYISQAKEKSGVKELTQDELIPIPADIQADLDEIMNRQSNNQTSSSTGTSNSTSAANKQAQIDAINAEYNAKISALKSERDRVYNDILADYAAMTGGIPSSWAKSAAEQGVAQYDTQIAALENERDAKIAALQ